MASKRIKTQLTISAVDEYSSKLRNMRAVTGRFADGVRTEMSRLQGLRGALKLIEDFKSAQAKSDQARAAFEAQRREVKRLRDEMKNHATPTDAMVRDMEKARTKAKRLREAYEGQREKLGQLNTKLQEAGLKTNDLGAEQRQLVGDIDRASTAFARQMDRMGRLETMQSRIAGARARMDRSLATAANLSFVGNASMQSGRRVLTALSDISGRAGDLEAQFADFQNLTGVDDTRLVQLRAELDGLRDVTKTSVSEMLDGLGVLVGKGMDFEDALAALPAAGRAAKATKTSFDEMGASGFALYDNLKVAPEDLRKAFDIMAMGGKEGGFELSAMARKFPEITAGARALKMEGLDSVAQLTAALQVAMKSAGSEDQAATNLSNFLGKLTSPETVRRFAKMGVSIEAELRQAAENGTSPFEHMLGVINDLTGGDALKMGELFGDKQVLDFLRAMIPNLEEYRRIKGAALSGDGVIDADLERVMATYNESKAQLGESVGKLFSLPPEVLESLTGLFQTADAIVERMIVWKKENPKLIKTLFLGASALGGMAVAGGALLTGAAGLIGTLAVLRFGLVGLGARAVFAAGDLMGVGGAFRGLAALPRFALATLIKPVQWTSRFVSRIPWALLSGGKFALAGLLTPLRWSRRLVPAIGWGSLAGGLKWPSLIKPLSWLGRGALRFIPVIGWAALAGELSWHLLIKPLGWDKYLKREALRGYLDEVKSWFSWDFIPTLDLGQFWKWPEVPPIFRRIFGLDDGPALEGIDALEGPDRRAAQVVTAASNEGGALPTPARIAQLRAEVAAYRAELEAAQAALEATPASGNGILNPLRVQAETDLFAAEAGLQRAEDRLNSAQTSADDLSAALQVIHGTEVAPEIGTASIERANELLAQMISGLQTVSSAGANVTATATGRGRATATGRATAKPAGARAGGGAVRMGLPYLVNENTPRSEWFVPSRSGGVLNVGQAQAAFRAHLSAVAPGPAGRNPELARLHRGAQGLRAASLAVLTSSALAAPAAAQPAQAAKPGAGAVTVHIGNFAVHVPSGVSDPDAIAELVADRIGQRVAATMSASFSD